MIIIIHCREQKGKNNIKERYALISLSLACRICVVHNIFLYKLIALTSIRYGNGMRTCHVMHACIIFDAVFRTGERMIFETENAPNRCGTQSCN